MNNPNDVVQNKHLDALAARIAGNIGGGSGGGQIVLGTTPQTVNGGLWYELDTNEAPALRMRYGNKIYAFASSWNSNAQTSDPSVVTPDTPDTQTGYGLYDSNDILLATLDEASVHIFSLEQADQLEGSEDYDTFYDTFLAWSEDYAVIADDNGKTVSDCFWFAEPSNLPANFSWLKYPFTCAGEAVEVNVNDRSMEVQPISGNEYYAKLTEFGALTIFNYD